MAIKSACNNKGRWVTTNPARYNTWCNKEQLGGLVRLRYQARRKMLEHQTHKSKEEYYHSQQFFKQKVWELKSNHWRKLLAEKVPNHAYQAYKFTKNKQEEGITPLKNQEGNLTSDITEKIVPTLLWHLDSKNHSESQQHNNHQTSHQG
ncbi:hypothetical protein O181_100214 [Austropuccinia psidii MF-1]|uniref:Uncharacterized protein n=1 Tax=Austropuccinia psidii MF-1 TaxID=1389203 RepID=A0A9Q3JES3_9BASI|nr:hypothetical protein [Austropuccinia psidii MF-1]